MHSKRTIHGPRRRSTAFTLLLVAALVAASCGDDDDDAAPGTTAPPGPHESHECVFRPGELIAPSDSDEEITEVFGQFEAKTSLTPEELAGSEFDVGLSLYRVDPNTDMLEAAADLAASNSELEFSLNYLTAFSPNWKYAPYNEPEGVSNEGLEPPELSTDFAVAVLDTGFTDVPGAPAQWAPAPGATTEVQRISLPSPPASQVSASPGEEVLGGRAAGHGTFIVNVLAQILPGAPIYAAGIEPRFDGDDAYLRDDGTAVSVRDDATLVWALQFLLGQEAVDYINMSFGTYGCASGGDGEPAYAQPLGLRKAIDLIAQRNELNERDETEARAVEVFAASGNDGHRDGDAVFYPAAWAHEFEWLHSVASVPMGTDDYSNRASWVELEANGNNVVSMLPETVRPDPGSTSTSTTTGGPVATVTYAAGWYRWSGTSFATPCALAVHASGGTVTPASPATTVSGTTRTTTAPPAASTSCGLNMDP